MQYLVFGEFTRLRTARKFLLARAPVHLPNIIGRTLPTKRVSMGGVPLTVDG